MNASCNWVDLFSSVQFVCCEQAYLQNGGKKTIASQAHSMTSVCAYVTINRCVCWSAQQPRIGYSLNEHPGLSEQSIVVPGTRIHNIESTRLDKHDGSGGSKFRGVHVVPLAQATNQRA